VLATGGVILAGVVFDERSLRGARLVGPGVVVAVITVILFASLSIVLTPPIRTYGWLPIVVGSRIAHLGVSVALLAVAARSGSPRFGPLMRPTDPLTRTAIALLVVAGVCDIAGFGAYSVGLEIAPVWLVGLASSFGPVLVIVYAVTRMGERLRPTQWLGLALIAGGIAVLAVAG
jgi:drug/metabolite transporter (DMT)-like permease